MRYGRRDGSLETFRQLLVDRSAEGLVTLLPAARVSAPIRIGGRVALEPGAPIVWLTVPGAWYDVGRFHTRDGAFTGYYTNILTPPAFAGPLEWRTDDLVLDVWLDPRGAVELLDEEEFARARASGALDGELARRARAEADRIVAAARRGAWPPDAIRRWTLERARAASGTAPGEP